MVIYKQPCKHCGTYISRDALFCPRCKSSSPIRKLCPHCLQPVEKGPVCPGCGRSLYVKCPVCGKQTFIQNRCEVCGASLMVRCPNPHCGAPQFFKNSRCTGCGMKILSGRK